MKIIKAQALKQKPDDYTHIKFGSVFTDHMLEMDYQDGKWGEIVIRPYEDFVMSPATMCLHYGQGIFEGAKAFRNEQGKVTLFRIDDNLSRMNLSARRMCIPEFDVHAVKAGLLELIKIEKEWVPKQEGTALYIRPSMIATEAALGVKVSSKYKLFIIMSPVGPYLQGIEGTSKIMIEDQYVRASVGGTGEAKCIGNYAAGMYPTYLAKQKGYAEVLWLDAKEHKYIEEVGTMNVMLVIDNKVYTPALTGSILRGITRDSAIKILRDSNIELIEEHISVDFMLKAFEEGKFTEMFGVGTAAVISPIGTLNYKGKDYVLNGNKSGPVAKMLYQKLDDIRKLRVPDKYHWLTVLD